MSYTVHIVESELASPKHYRLGYYGPTNPEPVRIQQLNSATGAVPTVTHQPWKSFLPNLSTWQTEIDAKAEKQRLVPILEAANAAFLLPGEQTVFHFPQFVARDVQAILAPHIR